MYRQAAVRAVRAGRDQDLGQDWLAQDRAAVSVRAAPVRTLPRVVAAAGRAEPVLVRHQMVAPAAAIGRRAARPADSLGDSWRADSSRAAAGNRAAADKAAAAAAAAGHPERSTADAAGRRISSRIALPPERPSQAPRRWQ